MTGVQTCALPIFADAQAAVLPGVNVVVTNQGTGNVRETVSGADGSFIASGLVPGTYKVTAELQGFKKFEQTGITLRSGQTAVIDVTLGVGAIAETITVTADSPLIDAARIDIGHSLSDQEVHSLPLVARNPYNFALVQPGVTGTENVEFGVPRLVVHLDAEIAASAVEIESPGLKHRLRRAGVEILERGEIVEQRHHIALHAQKLLAMGRFKQS
mgnify:CR=1 FL=1